MRGAVADPRIRVRACLQTVFPERKEQRQSEGHRHKERQRNQQPGQPQVQTPSFQHEEHTRGEGRDDHIDSCRGRGGVGKPTSQESSPAAMLCTLNHQVPTSPAIAKPAYPIFAIVSFPSLGEWC